MLARLLSRLFQALNRSVDWHKLPFWVSLANLVMLRVDLRQQNLFDTQRVPPPPPDPGVDDVRANRTADGSHNDLAQPGMGQANARFGRNAPIADTFGETEPGVLDPNPRLISRNLLARGDTLKPVPHLNVHVAAWLQFMVHDWFSHGANVLPDDKSVPEALRKPFEIPLPDGDDWPDNPMIVRRTRPDPETGPADEGKPTAYHNIETHWWDSSQIYGSSKQRQDAIRRNPKTGKITANGKIYLDRNGHLPVTTLDVGIGRKGEMELTGVNGNWWIGLSVMHTLFAREHNVICDRLKLEYPDATNEWLFNKARLIVAALIAKIHTVEWTPALLNTPTMRMAMRANWWGLIGEKFIRGFGRQVKNDVLGGIIGGQPDHHSAPYAMTEEFNAVYRMHSLLPDLFNFRSHGDDAAIATRSLGEVAGENAHKLYETVSLVDTVYTLGTEHPGLLTLHNFPESLRGLNKQAPSSRRVDVATIDIVRDRERGVPRYCAFRRHLRMKVPNSFIQLTGGDKEAAKELETVYGDVEKVDLLVGCAAEKWPEGFGFSDTAFRIFILMASRRLSSDRFFTSDFTPEVYTPVGIRWVADNSMTDVLLRHFPELADNLAGVKNAFFPWRKGA